MSGKTILIYPYAHQFGSTAPVVMLGKYLRELGHNVIFAGSGKYMFLPQNAGFDVEQVDVIPYDLFLQSMKVGNYKMFFDPIVQKDLLMSDIYLFKKINPDLVIHYIRYTAPIAGHLLNIKVAGFLFVGLTHYYLGPPRMPTLDKNIQIFHKLPFTNSYTKLWPQIVKTVGTLHAKKMLNWANQITVSNDFKNYQHLLFSSNIKPMLMDSLYLFPAHSLNDFYHIHPFIQDLIQPTSNEAILKQLKQLKKQCIKIVLLNLGSSTLDRVKIFASILEIFKHKKNIAFVIPSFDDKQIHKLALFKRVYGERLILTGLVSIPKLASYIDISVIHGGRGNLYDNIYNLIPSIVIPNTLEQEINGLTLEVHKIGKVLYKEELFDKHSDKEKKLHYMFNELFKIHKNDLHIIRKKVFSKDWRKDFHYVLQDLNIVQ